MRSALVVVLLAASASLGATQKNAPPKSPLTTAQTLRCTFQSFVATDWTDGAPHSVVNPQNFTFQIDTINVKKRTARIVAGQASAVASALLTDTSLNVIEQAPLGNFLLTSVFAAGGTGTTLLAVHSRHLGDLQGLPSAYQHFGTCEVLK